MIDTLEQLIKRGLIISEDNYISGCNEDNSLEGVIKIPDSIKGFKLGGTGFANCTKITHIELPPNIGSLHNGIFDGCRSLVSINIPDSADYIGSDTFRNCYSLRYIFIPKGTRRINHSFVNINIHIEVDTDNPNYSSYEGSLYDNQKKLLLKYYSRELFEEVNVPNTIESIESYCFSGCATIHAISLPDAISLEDYCFAGCINLQKVYLPSNMSILPYHAFDNCISLKEVELNGNHILTEIKGWAFNNCRSLRHILLPQSVRKIGYNGFTNCESLESVVLLGDDVIIEDNAFYGCVSLIEFRYKRFSINNIFSLLPDSINLKIVENEDGEIDVANILQKHEVQLKMMSMLYHGFGMNITKIRGNGTNPKSFKDLDENWPYSLIDFYDNSQSVEFLLKENWFRNSGIGLVLGWNNYRAIDVDECHANYWKGGISRNLIEDFLSFLGLPKDYKWVVESGSKRGFHIIFKSDIKFNNEFASVAYTPNLHYVYNRFNSSRLFDRLELRWRDHLILPPSIHKEGGCYEFLNGIPNSEPSELCISAIDMLINHYCGRTVINSYSFQGKQFKLADNIKCYAVYDSWSYDPEIKEDTIEWLENSKTSEALNSIGLRYLLGNGVEKNDAKAKECLEESDSDWSHFNLASLIACGYFTGSFSEVENHLRAIQDESVFSYVEYEEYDENKQKELFQEVLDNAANLKTNMDTKSEFYLFLDTETTCLPKDRNAPVESLENWPRIVQLAWILTNETGRVIDSKNFIVKPYGFSIPHDSTLIHGISNERANEFGVPIRDALQSFISDFKRCSFVVGHNVEFDKKVIGAELIRLGCDDIMESKTSICTMESSINLCALSGKHGYRYPKLNELHNYLFGYGFENAHDAFNDIEATMKCFFEMRKRKLL